MHIFIFTHSFFTFSCGYFIEPTIVQTKDPKDKIMTEEIFGPVLTVYVYKDSKIDETLDLVGSSTPFALTGAVFAKDESVYTFSRHCRTKA